MNPANQTLSFNGINAATGTYGLELNADELAQLLFANASPDELRDQKVKYTDAVDSAVKKNFRGTKEGVDATDIGQAGWGLIFAFDDPRVNEIQEALQPLLTLRQKDAGIFFRIFTGPDAYRPEESKIDFLRRHKVGTGAVDPSKGVPYYLLLIGSPELIPYEFQYQLDVQFAVGRLDFETIDEYAQYAHSVVAAETKEIQLDPTATFFSVANEDDSATQKTDRLLVQPLFGHLNNEHPEWDFDLHQENEANRSRLERLLGGDDKPALLFTASHGIEFPLGDPKQELHQGALLCSEWPGPLEWAKGQPLTEDLYMAGEHIADTADPSGMVAFHFACYGGGTPAYYDFARKESRERYPIADRPFVAQLPKRLLGHPNGGALAVVSHVDRAWSYSFQQGEKAQTTVFESAITRLLKGLPLGWAMEFFNNRYAELSSDLNQEIDKVSWNSTSRLEPYELATLWTENNDARNYIILGDPAVRLAVETAGRSSAREAVAPVAQSVQRLEDGRPITISQNDWTKTPVVVQNALTNALDQIDQLTARLTEAEKAARSAKPERVLRDGGRSLRERAREEQSRPSPTRGGDAIRGATTRSGGMRGEGRGGTRGGNTRGGTTRGGGTRGGNTRGG